MEPPLNPDDSIIRGNMETMNYERHTHIDSTFPIIFHLDHIRLSTRFQMHWHKGIELLYIIQGTVSVRSGPRRIIAAKDEIVIINSNDMHHICSIGGDAKYFCLIIDKHFCEEYGVFTSDIVFTPHISDKKILRKYINIKNELIEKKAMYKTAAKAAIVDLLVHLYREYSKDQSPITDKKNLKSPAVKESLSFIDNNYASEISTADIAWAVGLSEAYFCRIFKEATGFSVVDYINFVRCSNAKKILQSGEHTVSEAAALCGFYNLSYFSRTYKKHMGALPSEHKKEGILPDDGEISQYYIEI